MNFKRPLCLVHKSCEVILESLFSPFEVESFLEGVPCLENFQAPSAAQIEAPFLKQWCLKNIRRPIRDTRC